MGGGSDAFRGAVSVVGGRRGALRPVAEKRGAVVVRTLGRVLVIDIRYTWNGLGNSLTRWLNLLRVGLATSLGQARGMCTCGVSGWRR